MGAWGSAETESQRALNNGLIDPLKGKIHASSYRTTGASFAVGKGCAEYR
jgi:hypothetical protein